MLLLLDQEFKQKSLLEMKLWEDLVLKQKFKLLVLQDKVLFVDHVLKLKLLLKKVSDVQEFKLIYKPISGEDITESDRDFPINFIISAIKYHISFLLFPLLYIFLFLLNYSLLSFSRS